MLIIKNFNLNSFKRISRNARKKGVSIHICHYGKKYITLERKRIVNIKQNKIIAGIDNFKTDTIDWQFKIFYTEKEATKYILQTFYCDYFYLAKLDENNAIDLKTIKKIKTNNIKL